MPGMLRNARRDEVVDGAVDHSFLDAMVANR